MKPTKMPEDTLNIELKYIDENIRPLYHECNEAIAQYEAKEENPMLVLIKLRGLNRSLIPTNRFKTEKINEIETEIEEAKKLINIPKKFTEKINDIFKTFSWSIADKKLFSRYAPTDDEDELDEDGLYAWV